MSKYDWPETKGLVALVKKHGQPEAARRLGVPYRTLNDHLVREGVPQEDRRQERRSLNADAIKEIRDLIET